MFASLFTLLLLLHNYIHVPSMYFFFLLKLVILCAYSTRQKKSVRTKPVSTAQLLLKSTVKYGVLLVRCGESTE